MRYTDIQRIYEEEKGKKVRCPKCGTEWPKVKGLGRTCPKCGRVHPITEVTEKRDEEPSDYPKDDEDKNIKIKKKKKRKTRRPKTGYDTKADSFGGDGPRPNLFHGAGALYTDKVPRGNLVEQAAAIRNQGMKDREQREKDRKRVAKERIKARMDAVHGQKERLSDRLTALKRRKERI